MNRFVLLFTLANSIAGASLSDPNLWSVKRDVPVDGTPNVLELPDQAWEQAVHEGQIHAQIYPVEITGLLVPAAPLKNMINEKSRTWWQKTFDETVDWLVGVENWNQLLLKIGLVPPPAATDTGVYTVTWPTGHPSLRPLGYGEITRDGSTGFTISCGACHAGRLFGKTVLGLTNRFPRANEIFVTAKKIAPFYNSWLFQDFTGATDADATLMSSTFLRLNRVAAVMPLRRGLDTSLAQVALSLNRRAQDPYATPSPDFEANPRPDPILDTMPADSKPAVWWNLKYKNRWLSDGSVVAGDPIYTNILWNEIGRGTDLQELEKWMEAHPKVIQSLTAMVFASQPPRFTDFFSAEHLQPARVKAGQHIFNQRCAHCHGLYEKAWDDPASQSKPWREQLQTLHVIPRPITPIHDVDTDPQRRLGMKSLEKLNDLNISKAHGIVVQAQAGYVPPPLVGIWARWPYLHNNSIPSLCALLTPSAQRPVEYDAGPAEDPKTDFDLECNGYPLGDRTPEAWKEDPIFHFDSRVRGLSNRGHDEDIFAQNGVSQLSHEDRRNLIQFLQTL